MARSRTLIEPDAAGLVKIVVKDHNPVKKQTRHIDSVIQCQHLMTSGAFPDMNRIPEFQFPVVFLKVTECAFMIIRSEYPVSVSADKAGSTVFKRSVINDLSLFV